MKVCTGKNGCGKTKALSEFSTDNSLKDGLCRNYRECDYKRRRAHKLSKPEVNKNWYLGNKYGITLEEYTRMFKFQEGRCGICKDVYESLVVDHDHTTGKVRKLLCSNCNTGIGLLKEPKCEVCLIAEWNGEELGFELDHIDRDHFNNALSNLQILCPNCHAQKTRKDRASAKS